MSGQANSLDQAAFVAEMARRKPGIGRTALMKYAYLLQTVKRVPLGFDFSLYAYGPYDTAVLDRISTAERWSAVEERTVRYPNGSTGYEIYPSNTAEELLTWGGEFLKPYEQQMNWVVEQFSGYNAADMELIGTMVYADREAAALREKRTKDELIEIVLRIKPRFSHEQSEQIYDRLREMGALIAANVD